MNINSLIGNQRKQRAKAKGFGDYKNNKEFTPGINEEYANTVAKAVDQAGATAEDELLDQLVEEGRQYLIAENNYNIDTAGAAPLDFQEAVIEGRARLPQQAMAKARLQGKTGEYIPGYEFTGKDWDESGMERPIGIMGSMQDDSDVVLHVTPTGQLDPMGLPEVAVFKNAGDAVYTEKLNREGRSKVKRGWVDRVIESPRYQYASDSDRTKMLIDEKFNSFAGEYYGNQYQVLKGNMKPELSDRSTPVQNYAGRHQSDRTRNIHPEDSRYKHRVLEGYSRIDEPELEEKADFRYVTPDDKLVVGDYETNSGWDNQRQDPVIMMNLLKEHNLSQQQVKDLIYEVEEEAYARKTQGMSDLDIGNIIEQIVYDAPGMRMTAGYDRAQSPGSMRPGKIINDSPMIGQEIYPDNITGRTRGERKSQDKMEEIIYGLHPTGSSYNSTTEVAGLRSSDPRAMIPQMIVSADTSKLREYIGNQVAMRANERRNPTAKAKDGGTIRTDRYAPYVKDRLSELQKAGVINGGIDRNLYAQLLSR